MPAPEVKFEDVSGLADDKLDEELKKATEKESGGSEEPEETPPAGDKTGGAEKPEDKKKEEDPPVDPDPEKKGKEDDPPEGKPGDKEEEVETPPEDYSNLTQEQLLAKLKDTQESLNKQEKRLRDKDSFIGKQGHEIGDLRKTADQLKTDLEAIEKRRKEISASKIDEEEFNTDFIDNPLKKIEAFNAQKTTVDENKELDIREHRIRTKQFVMDSIPNFEGMIDEIAVVAKELGAPDNAVADFKKDPYLETPALLMKFAYQVTERRRGKELEDLRNSIKASKDNKEEVADKIEKTVKQKKPITSSAGKPNTEIKSVKESQIADLSDEALDKQLEGRLKQERS